MVVKCARVRYTNRHLGTPISIILMNFYRKCLGSIWNVQRRINAYRPQRQKDRCDALSQGNQTCEVCHTFLRWLHKLPKGRRALRPINALKMDRPWSVNIQKVLCFEVFNYFGIHGLFDAVAKLYPSLCVWQVMGLVSLSTSTYQSFNSLMTFEPHNDCCYHCPS